METFLYVLSGIIVWCLIGYISAWIDFKYDIVDGKSVNDGIVFLTLIGAVTTVIILQKIVFDRLEEKLKFKENK